MAKSSRTTKKPTPTSGETATVTRTSRPSPSAGHTEQPVTNGGADRAAIARRAYEIFQARGGQHGYEIEDWLQAERELSSGGQDEH